jgi:heme oxygenase
VTARAALKASTATDHERVDALFSRFDLGTRRGYGSFLCAQAAALLPAEAALDEAAAEAVVPDWSSRRRSALLLADLADLSIAAPEPSGPVQLCGGNAPLLGAIYVLEGSRLGAALLRRKLAEGLPAQFLSGSRDAGSWRKLLKLLDESLIRPDEVEAATAAARLIFARFQKAAQRQLEAATSE